jgi:colicin import membrane protein
MNTELQISHPQNLDAVLRLTDAHLFTPEMLTRALDLLAGVAGPLVADVTHEDGRREINRMARAVGGAIARLDERRRAYVAALKAQPKAVDDLFRTTFRQPAEILKARIRAPLSAWEEDIRAADDETTRLVALLNAPVASGTTAAAIRQRLDAARALALPDWLSATQRGAIVAAMERNLPRLEAALEAASRAEEQAAELARLRAVARDTELLAARTVAAEEATRAAHAQQAAREEQIRQEAAATARAAALAEVAQRVAPAPAPATAPTPTAPPEREDRALIHRAILADLEDLGIPTETAKRLISAIARGQIFHLAITY